MIFQFPALKTTYRVTKDFEYKVDWSGGNSWKIPPDQLLSKYPELIIGRHQGWMNSNLNCFTDWLIHNPAPHIVVISKGALFNFGKMKISPYQNNIKITFPKKLNGWSFTLECNSEVLNGIEVEKV